MKTRRILALIGVFLAALLLAFPLRGAVYGLIVVPIAYLLWLLDLFYHAMPSGVWWGLLVFLVAIFLFLSLMPEIKPVKRAIPGDRPPMGEVERLALWLKRGRRGIYFKWLVANRLGKIAHEILLQRMGGKTRSFLDPLTGPDWEPDSGIRSYLEAGLGGSFADYPLPRLPFAKPVRTPLDHEVKTVIDFLESQLESASHQTDRIQPAE